MPAEVITTPMLRIGVLGDVSMSDDEDEWEEESSCCQCMTYSLSIILIIIYFFSIAILMGGIIAGDAWTRLFSLFSTFLCFFRVVLLISCMYWYDLRQKRNLFRGIVLFILSVPIVDCFIFILTFVLILVDFNNASSLLYIIIIVFMVGIAIIMIDLLVLCGLIERHQTSLDLELPE